MCVKWFLTTVFVRKRRPFQYLSINFVSHLPHLPKIMFINIFKYLLSLWKLWLWKSVKFILNHTIEIKGDWGLYIIIHSLISSKNCDFHKFLGVYYTSYFNIITNDYSHLTLYLCLIISFRLLTNLSRQPKRCSRNSMVKSAGTYQQQMTSPNCWMLHKPS